MSAYELCFFSSLHPSSVVISSPHFLRTAYAPQLGARLNISHTKLNVIGSAGNFGVYGTSAIWGRVIDARGPRIPFTSAFFLLLIGYSGIRLLYEHGLTHNENTLPSFTFLLLVACSLITGVGASAGGGSAINSTAKTFPDSARATAVGLVLSGFGLSAFLFSTVSRVLFPGNTSDFLLILALGTALPMILGFFFVRPIPLPHSGQQRGTSTSTSLDDGRRTSISDAERLMGPRAPLLQHGSLHPTVFDVEDEESEEGVDERIPTSTSSTSRFLSRRRALLMGDASLTNMFGTGLFKSSDFWLLFVIMSLLSGTGVVYINNVGSMSQVLYAKQNAKYDDIEASKWQTTQVSVISVMSCAGRIIIGLICDYGKRRFDIPRSASLILVSSLFFISQVAAANIGNIHNLWIPSAILGLANGSMFTLFATMCSVWFGMPHFAENYGYLQIAPIFAGNLFSVIFGRNLDAHDTGSSPHILGPPRCSLGKECYVATLYLTMGACFLGIVLSAWACSRDREKLRKATAMAGSGES
ncbi:hypothetical protein M378DRAFT_15039 [Amanita muscaria Koide BX008]|uniref:MFS general substrate transporter n=1 Tax=Amanita muscaria (strain Koide BX008) TaxID=946122 RepID=A0A0C2WR15_AMAMK|nr:hypothetical protein M378DRAFT_15039 [Amanita muscaria Koide BX008]